MDKTELVVSITDLANSVNMQSNSIRYRIARGMLPGPDLQSPAGRRYYSESLFSEVRSILLKEKRAMTEIATSKGNITELRT